MNDEESSWRDLAGIEYVGLPEQPGDRAWYRAFRHQRFAATLKCIMCVGAPSDYPSRPDPLNERKCRLRAPDAIFTVMHGSISPPFCA